MKRMFASILGVTLGLLSAGQAAEIEWKAARAHTPPPPAPALIQVQALDGPTIVPAPAPAPAPAPLEAPPPGRFVPRAEPRNRDGTVSPTPRSTQQRSASAKTTLLPISAVGTTADGATWVRVKAQNTDGTTAERILTIPTPSESPKSTVPAAEAPKSAGPLSGKLVMGAEPTAEGQYPVYLLTDSPEMFATNPDTGRFYGRAEFLLWWLKGGSVPPLATTSPDPGFAPGGTLNNPNTTVLLGGNQLDSSFRQGGRFTVGAWLDDERSCGFEASYFFLGSRGRGFTADSSEFPRVYRPFFQVNSGGGFVAGESSEQVFNVNSPAGSSTGSFSARQNSQFWGADLNYQTKLCCGCNYRFDLLAGFRYLNLDESLTIVENATVITPPMAPDGTPLRFGPDGIVFTPGTQITTVDRFSTRNDFYGGQLGGRYHTGRDRWSLDVKGTVALGTTHQRLSIDGYQTVQRPGEGLRTFPGGLLALPSNIGDRSRDVFSVVPEIGVTLGYQVTDHLKLLGGYNFLYWSNVIRPGDQIDRNLDITQIPNFIPNGVNVPSAGQTQPAARFNSTDFWAQGVTVGLEYRW